MVIQLPIDSTNGAPQIFKTFMIMALDSSSASLIIPTVLSAGLFMDKDTRLYKQLYVYTIYNELLCHTTHQFLTMKAHSL